MGTPSYSTSPYALLLTANTWTKSQVFKGNAPWYDIKAYGATGDGTTDDRAALASADSAAQTAFGASSGAYVRIALNSSIQSNITVISSIDCPPGTILKPASGVTITLNGYVNAGQYKIFDLSAGGTVVLTQGQVVRAEWWGNDSSGLQRAITATAEGSDVLFQGKWTTTGITMIASRDRNKRLMGVGGYGERLNSSTVGAAIFLTNSANTDVINVNWDSSRSGITLSNFIIDGNNANNTSGAGLRVTNAIELTIPVLFIQNTVKEGAIWPNSTTSNQNWIGYLNANNAGKVGVTSNGVDIQGLADSYFDTISVGSATGDGIVFAGSNVQGNKIRSFSNTGNGANYSGGTAGPRIASIHVNNNGQNGLVMFGNGALFNSLYALDNGTDGTQGTNRAGLNFRGSSANNVIGMMYATDDQGSPTQQYHIRSSSTGVGNEVTRLSIGVAGVTKSIQLSSTAAQQGTKIGVPASQQVTYASSVTINPYVGRLVEVTLTGNITFANPATDQMFDGQIIDVAVTQDATGGRTVTWGSSFSTTSPVNPAASSVTTWRFINNASKYYQIASSSVPSLTVATKTTTYTLTSNDDVILGDTTSAGFTITLHSAVTAIVKAYRIKNIGTKTLTLNTTSAQTIDGSTSLTMPVANQTLELIPDGANWQIT